MHSLSLPRNGVCFPCSSANAWNKNQEDPVVIFIFFLHCLLYLLQLNGVAPCQTGGEALLPWTLPRSTRGGIKETLAYVCWRHGDLLSLLFHSAENCSSFFCCNSVIRQTKEAQAKSIICPSWVSFLFLSQSCSVEAAQAQATSSSSVFCHGKKIETQEQENMALL